MSTPRIYPVLLLLVVYSAAGGGADAALDVPVVEPLEVVQNNAAAGDPSSQYNLALLYQKGRGVTKDAALALAWYRKAAGGGFTAAQYNLGVLLVNGTEVPRDEKEAARWFDAAARSGSFEAQKALVKLYSAGRGVEKSPARALGWDMIARRTLLLRHGIDAGLPPKPGALRADGAAEVTGKDGQKEWMHPDGSRERIDEKGVRNIESPDGRKTTVQTDGAWQTLYPGGLTEEVTAQGRRTLRDGKGQVEITETDGSQIKEGNGTDGQGNKVRIRDTFAPDGQKISRRVIGPDSTFEERADGARVLETKVQREDGVACLLRQEVGEDGALGKGRLTRADTGAGPKDAEVWSIRRILQLRGGRKVQVIEKYSEAGFYAQEVVKELAANPPPAPPIPQIRPIAPLRDISEPRGPEMPPPAPISVTVPPSIPISTQSLPGQGSSGTDDPTAFAPKPDIRPMLKELEAIENEARYFAGATEADYQRAWATASAYTIPLPAPPQKTASAPAWLREKTISTTTLHEFALTPILDDRSKTYPFGPHGAELIKEPGWKHAECPHFIVHYRGEAEAKLALQFIEGAYTVLTQLMNLDAARGAAKSHVFVFPEQEWQGYLQKMGHPAQLAGFAYKTELLLGAATNRQDRSESIKVLCHEVTHALVSRFYPGQHPPLWMNEGLADYIALRTMRAKNVPLTISDRGASSSSSSSSSRARTPGATQVSLLGRADAVMDVEMLFRRVRYGSQTTPDRLAAFYANSQKCVQVLFEKLPVEQFATFFNALAAGNRPEAALSTAFGKQCDSVAALQRLINAR